MYLPLADPMQGSRVGCSVPATTAGRTGPGREELEMAEGAVDVTVNASPDAVWAKVGDFAGVGDFFPGIESFRLEGDDRVIGMFGMEIRERLLSRDDAARTISYSVVEGVPIESHTATISVEADGDGSKVTWAYDVEPAEMAPIFGDTYKAALAAVEAAFS
jgi:mxaD protein